MKKHTESLFEQLKRGKISVEELVKNTNLQPFLTQLQSSDAGEVVNALKSLTTFIVVSERKDALYALAGYYVVEIHTLEQIEKFFNKIEMAKSLHLARIILTDIVKYKEMSRHRLFMDNFLRYLSSISDSASPEDLESFIDLIENGVWGDKLKRKCIDTIMGFSSY